MLNKTTILAALAATLSLTAPALAQDVAAGEKQFNKCKACHMIVADDGTEIQRGGKIGPNTYGAVGDGILLVKEKGLVWDEAMIAEYVKDPTKWLDANSGDPKARSKMAFKLAKGGEDVAAYLASVGPAPAEAAPASN
jgi:cytochrome c